MRTDLDIPFFNSGSHSGSERSLSTIEDFHSDGEEEGVAEGAVAQTPGEEARRVGPEGTVVETPYNDDVAEGVERERTAVETPPSQLGRPALISKVSTSISGARKPESSNAASETNAAEKSTPKYVLAFTFVLLVGRAFSCAYRYVTTQEAQKFIGQEPFIHQYGQNWWTIFTETGAILFCATDAFLTIVGSKDSLTELCSFRETFKKNVALLRDENGKLPILKLIGWGFLLPGGMYGAFLKGKVGTQVVSSQITSLITDHPPEALSPLFSGLAYFSAASSMICYFAFQTQQALTQLRIMHALSNNPYWVELRKRDMCDFIGNVSVSFIISIAMALITMMSAFYDRGSFEIEWQTATKSLFIAVSSIIANTLYTSTPNNVFRAIQSMYDDFVHKGDAPNPHGLPYFLVMGIALISSTGNSLAVFPSIVHIMKLISGKDLANESWTNIVIGLAVAAFLGVAMFPRDFRYNGKRAIETLFTTPTVNNTAEPETPANSQKEGCFARFKQSFFCLRGATDNETQPNFDQPSVVSPA